MQHDGCSDTMYAIRWGRHSGVCLMIHVHNTFVIAFNCHAGIEAVMS